MGDVALTIRVQGSAEVLGHLKAIGATAQQTTQEAAQSTQKATTATADYRRSLIFVSSALAGAASIGAALARGNEDLQKTFTTISLTISGASTVLHTLASAMRVVTAVIGIKIAAVLALVGAIVFLVKNWDQAIAFLRGVWVTFGAFLRTLWAELAAALTGLGNAFLGILTFDPSRFMAGARQLDTALRNLGAIAVDVGKQALPLLGKGWEFLTGLFGQATKKTQELRDAVVVLGDAAETAFVRAFQATSNLTAALAAMGLMLQRIGERDITKQLIEGANALRVAVEQTIAPAFEKVSAELVEQFTVISDFIRTRAKADADAARDERLAQLTFELEVGRKTLAEKVALLEAELQAAELTVQQRRALELDLFRTRQQIAAQVKTALDEEIQIHLDHAARIAQANQMGAIDYLRAWRTALEETGRLTGEIASQIEQAIFRIMGMSQKTAPQVVSTWQQAWDAIKQGFAQTIGQMAAGLQQFKDFGDFVWKAIQNAFANLVEAMVTKFIKGLDLMKIAQQAFGFLSSVLKFIFPFLPFQHGGDLVVSRPTLMAVGERGAERVSVRPLAGGMAGAGGGGMTLNFAGPVVFDELTASQFVRRFVMPALNREYGRRL